MSPPSPEAPTHQAHAPGLGEPGMGEGHTLLGQKILPQASALRFTCPHLPSDHQVSRHLSWSRETWLTRWAPEPSFSRPTTSLSGRGCTLIQQTGRKHFPLEFSTHSLVKGVEAGEAGLQRHACPRRFWEGAQETGGRKSETRGPAA